MVVEGLNAEEAEGYSYDENLDVDNSVMDEPQPKRIKMEKDPEAPIEVVDLTTQTAPDTVTAYEWKYVRNNSDEQDQGVAKLCSTFTYLNYENCVSGGERSGMIPDNTVLKVYTVKIPKPSTVETINSVYSFLMCQEFELLTRNECDACTENGPHPEHFSEVNGCMRDKDVLVNRHGNLCHLKMSTPRLLQATNAMRKAYGLNHATWGEVITFLRKADGKETLAAERENGLPFEFFKKLQRM
jgi:hypothetical protein